MPRSSTPLTGSRPGAGNRARLADRPRTTAGERNVAGPFADRLLGRGDRAQGSIVSTPIRCAVGPVPPANGFSRWFASWPMRAGGARSETQEYWRGAQRTCSARILQSGQPDIFRCSRVPGRPHVAAPRARSLCQGAEANPRSLREHGRPVPKCERSCPDRTVA